jgi:hypothetical protein
MRAQEKVQLDMVFVNSELRCAITRRKNLERAHQICDVVSPGEVIPEKGLSTFLRGH